MKPALLRFAFLGILAGQFSVAAPVLSAAPQPGAPGTRELIRDPHFERGCRLYEPKTGRHVEYGTIAGVAKDAQPVWGLAQWSSREKLLPAPPQMLPSGALCYSNAAKAVTFGAPGTADADLALAVNGGFEYAGRPRRKGEPWPHLLVEQRVENPPSLAALSRAQFHIAARLKNSRRRDMPGYSPQVHAATIQIFFTLQNQNKKSAGYGKYLWFGVPFYDDRHRFSKSHQAQDGGKADATGMFIYTVAGSEFTTRSFHDREWVTIDKDLLPYMRAGLQTAWQRGFLTDSQSLADYRISGMNLGWEVTGILDVEMQLRDLSLKVTENSTAK